MTLQEETDKIQGFIESPLPETPDEIVERLKTLIVLHARSGDMYALAKKIWRDKLSQHISQTILSIAEKGGLSKSVQNAMLDSLANDEAYLVDKLDRVNSSICHQMDAIRSILSYEKEAMKMTNNPWGQ